MIVIHCTCNSDSVILSSNAFFIINFEKSIESVFDKIKLRSGMKKTAKLQQVRLITSPTENNNSSDVEDAAPSDEGYGSEMVSVTERVENQKIMRISTDEERSIVSTINL